MDKLLAFKVFCLENYKIAHNLTGEAALAVFEKNKVFDYITSCYDVLHANGRLCIISDIDEYIGAFQTCLNWHVLFVYPLSFYYFISMYVKKFWARGVHLNLCYIYDKLFYRFAEQEKERKWINQWLLLQNKKKLMIWITNIGRKLRSKKNWKLLYI